VEVEAQIALLQVEPVLEDQAAAAFLDQGFALFMHKYCFTLRWKAPGENTLSCGRHLTCALVPFVGVPKEGSTFCKQCIRGLA
jgi:hypothetical protein